MFSLVEFEKLKKFLKMNASNFTFEWRYNLNQMLSFYSVYTFLPAGFFLNIIQIIVYLRKKFSSTTMSIYYIQISVNNNLAIILTIVRFIGQIEFYPFEENTAFGCKFLSFFTRFSYASCSWFNFLMTLDRLAFILFANTYKKVQSKWFILKISLVIYLFLFAINTPNLFFGYTMITRNFTTRTVFFYFCTGSVELVFTREFFSQILGIFLPFGLMFASNIFLIYKVIESKKKINSNRETNFLFTVIISNVIFLVALIPFSINLLIRLIVLVNPEIETQIAGYLTFITLFETIGRIIMCFNFSAGLILQIFFNKIFRREFVQIIADVSSFFGIKNQKIAISTTSSSKM